MSIVTDDEKIDADTFADLVLHYSHNAEKYLRKRDYQKASETMWGAMSCTIKTAAAKENKSIRSHRALIKYTRNLAKRENDEEILNSMSKASLLHKNFYESDLDSNEIIEFAKDVAKTVGKLMNKMKYVKTVIPTTEHAICPNCGDVAQSRADIEKKFGFRDMGGIMRPQSWCKKCRNRRK